MRYVYTSPERALFCHPCVCSGRSDDLIGETVFEGFRHKMALYSGGFGELRRGTINFGERSVSIVARRSFLMLEVKCNLMGEWDIYS